jgi:hypothetical protein
VCCGGKSHQPSDFDLTTNCEYLHRSLKINEKSTAARIVQLSQDFTDCYDLSKFMWMSQICEVKELKGFIGDLTGIKMRTKTIRDKMKK